MSSESEPILYENFIAVTKGTANMAFALSQLEGKTLTDYVTGLIEADAGRRDEATQLQIAKVVLTPQVVLGRISDQ